MALKIIDLPDECHENIFKFLDFDDLLNVADSRKSWKNEVNIAFEKEYATRAFRFSDKSLTDDCKDSNDIEIFDFLTALKTLRCFGEYIYSLDISFKLQQKQRHLLNRYLSRYCSESLEVLMFSDAGKGAIDGVKKPFNQLYELLVSDVMGKNVGDFNRWFPNVRILTLMDIDKWTDVQFTEVHLPNLECLYFDGSSIPAKNVSNFIRLNPQLQTLTASFLNIDSSVLNAASECTQLENLHISYGKYIDTMDKVHFKGVKVFSVLFSFPLEKIPFSFDELEKFSATVQVLPSVSIIQQFISETSTVEKLFISFKSPILTDDKWQELEDIWRFGNGWRVIFTVDEYWNCIFLTRCNEHV